MKISSKLIATSALLAMTTSATASISIIEAMDAYTDSNMQDSTYSYYSKSGSYVTDTEWNSNCDDDKAMCNNLTRKDIEYKHVIYSDDGWGYDTTSRLIVNFVGKTSCTATVCSDTGTTGRTGNKTALKFILPKTNATLYTAQLELKTADVGAHTYFARSYANTFDGYNPGDKDSSSAVIVISDDNNWNETDDASTSRFPTVKNPDTLINVSKRFLLDHHLADYDFTLKQWDTTVVVPFNDDTLSFLQKRISPTANDTLTLIIGQHPDMVNEGNNNYWSIRSDDDAAYNSGDSAKSPHLVLHFFPHAQSISGPEAGYYKAGDTLKFKVAFDSALAVQQTTDHLSLPIRIGTAIDTARYINTALDALFDAGDTLLFYYVVRSTDKGQIGIDTANDSIVGGYIKSSPWNYGIYATRSLHNITVDPMTGVILDVEAPAVASVTGPEAGTYTSGKVLSFTVKTSEKVNVTGTPYIGITVGEASKKAAYVSGTGTDELTFSYTVAGGDNGALAVESKITLDTATIKDLAGNAMTDTAFTAPAVTGVNVDAVAPAVASVTGPEAGTYTSGNAMTFTVTYSEAVTVTGAPYIPLTIGTSTAQAAYVSGSGTSALTFTYKIASGDKDGDGITAGSSISLNEGSIADAAGNAASLDLSKLSIGTIIIEMPTAIAQNAVNAGYALRCTSSGSFHVEMPANVHSAELILLDAAGRKLTTRTLTSNTDIMLPVTARWSIAVLRANGSVKATARNR